MLLAVLSSFARSASPINDRSIHRFKNISILNIEPCSDLITFEAIKKANKVEFFWDIKTKTYHDYFTLERSKDGANFEKTALSMLAAILII